MIPVQLPHFDAELKIEPLRILHSTSKALQNRLTQGGLLSFLPPMQNTQIDVHHRIPVRPSADQNIRPFDQPRLATRKLRTCLLHQMPVNLSREIL